MGQDFWVVAGRRSLRYPWIDPLTSHQKGVYFAYTPSELDKEASCDHRPLLAADLLMYIALSHTVTGFFSPYLYMLKIMPMPTQVEQAEMSVILIGMAVAGSTAWILAAYVGPIVAFVRAPHGRGTKLLHAVGYVGLLVCISHLWMAAQRLEGLTPAGDSTLSVWFSAFAAPLFW